MLRSQKFVANANVFEKLVEEMNERAAADGRKNKITHSQVRNKCKSISLAM